MQNTLLIGFGLMLLLEGILPLLFPQVWRQTFQRMLGLNDGQLRFVGLISVAAGMLLIIFSQ